MNLNNSRSLRKKVAKEAASLLYFSVEKEYKQAKLKAAKTFGVHFLPANLEVAIELDKIAEENEGNIRQKRLIQLRQSAHKLMKLLEKYSPVLTGSVWATPTLEINELQFDVGTFNKKRMTMKFT